MSRDPSGSPENLGWLSLFRGLSTAEISELSRHLNGKTFLQGTLLLTAGHRSGVVYFIEKGTVKICAVGRQDREVIIAIVGPGEVIGEINAVDNLGHSASALTLESCSLFWMDREEFQACARRMPILTENLLQTLARRARFATARLQVMATERARGRLAAQILAFADYYGESRSDGSTLIPLRLTQSNLASLIGASRQHTNDLLSSFRKAGFIIIDQNHRITVLDQEALGSCE